MYLSSERLAIANQAVLETFEQTSIAWQAIPHWDTGDPAQTRVRNDKLDDPGFLPLQPKYEEFQLTLAQIGAPTPDSLLAEVMSKTVALAKRVDAIVLKTLLAATTPAGAAAAGSNVRLTLQAGDGLPAILKKLIEARATVEDAGYRAPSSLIVNTAGLIALNELESGYTAADSVLAAANVNSLHRVTSFIPGEDDDGDDDEADADPANRILLVLGRRQRIAHGDAADASPGEEPVDLAVSVLPSLEVVGDDADGDIELAVRISFATRIKDASGVVAIVGPPPA